MTLGSILSEGRVGKKLRLRSPEDLQEKSLEETQDRRDQLRPLQLKQCKL